MQRRDRDNEEKAEGGGSTHPRRTKGVAVARVDSIKPRGLHARRFSQGETACAKHDLSSDIGALYPHSDYTRFSVSFLTEILSLRPGSQPFFSFLGSNQVLNYHQFLEVMPRSVLPQKGTQAQTMAASRSGKNRRSANSSREECVQLLHEHMQDLFYSSCPRYIRELAVKKLSLDETRNLRG